MSNNFVDVLQTAVQKKASDIHIVIGKPPMIRILGEIHPLDGFPVIDEQLSQKLIYTILFDEQRRVFEEEQELDCSISVPKVARFRLNVFKARNGMEAVLRVINPTIPTADELGFSESVRELTNLTRGLVLVTGPTGSGKSTTQAALIEMINQQRKQHILTIEDPIEYVYQPKGCIIRQREIGTSTKSFGRALKSALREDPDVILLGEMRDLETISLALTAGETGHLVMGTLHTTDAPQTIDRIIDVFPAHQQQQVRVQLSTSLRAVICQSLIPTKEGKERIAAREVMVVTPAISNLIREGKAHMIYNAIETGAKHGMESLDQSLARMVKDRKISLDDAMAKARDPQKLKSMI